MIVKLLFAAIAVSLSFASLAFAQSDEINIIPKPGSVERRDGSFSFSPKTKLFISGKTNRQSGTELNDMLHALYGFRLQVVSKQPKEDYIELRSFGGTAMLWKSDVVSGSYSIEIDSTKILLTGIRTPEIGKFYAIQSFMQLLPPRFDGSARLPALKIEDRPRFPYRGMHLDVSRHFMPVEFVKKFIDQMAQYKFNTFHWHLTDDQGWRIEIKKYPKLTTVGQYRSESHEGSYSPIFKGDGRPIEGFYTQEQIKDVVAYAKERYITVIPEIELPGHASAALAAYPELGKGCAAPDHKFEVKKTWGIFKEVFCPTDETFKFLEDVLDETIRLFPDSPYIHIGGDEVLKDFWKESAFVQELKVRENLKDEHEVQSYFIRRIEKFVNSKGKKIIGWDEILEGGIAPNATIMSWRGMKGGIEAAKAKHDVIMTPTDYVYFDYGQGDPAYEPLNIGGYVPLEKVYSFEPVPPELTADEAKYILGGQANIWTEYIETPDKVEYMAFPRMLALSEVLWSRKEDRNFDDFRRRLNAILPRLDKQGVNYRIPEPSGLKNIVTQNEKVSIELQPAPGTRILYTTDGSTPSDSSAVYDKPIELSLAEGEVKMLKTVVVNGAGRKSSVYAATIVRGTMREPDALAATTPGVNFRFSIPRADMSGNAVERSGETRSMMLDQFAKEFDLKQTFAIEYSGYIKIAADGVYEFQADATWHPSVEIGGKKVIETWGTAERKASSAIVPLKAGLHKITLWYTNHSGTPFFRLRYGIKGQGLRQAFGGEFVH